MLVYMFRKIYDNDTFKNESWKRTTCIKMTRNFASLNNLLKDFYFHYFNLMCGDVD